MSIRAAIVAPTGYTGLYLIELLLRHPGAKLTYLASAREELPNIAEEFQRLQGRCEMVCRPIDPAAMAKEADVVFTCLPHKAAMEYVPGLLEAGLRVVDLSADYRLADPELYERTYKEPHTDRANLADAVYGLPELYAEQIADADLVANPGCYPTAAALAIVPLIQRSLVRTDSVLINAASGVTGAGRSAKAHLHFPELHNAFVSYGCGTHRHQPEINQTLSTVKGSPVSTLFVPHLLPIDRGILETIYLDPQDDDVTEEDLFEAFEDAYGKQPFVRVVSHFPNVAHVRDTNFCDVSVRLSGGKVVVYSAIDNMIKGASGQALQNMNLMFGQDESAGLI
ncbi:N-acetyl-gamma-glutamyl-phosphate reductase [Planctomycetales bacterium ZRK34]|nr:N-acetyl-gamma-glutamyl-phosphate reductase [Planctomycetales bacterium ZRK34]